MTLSASDPEPVTVIYDTADGTAIGGSDYVPVASTTLTFSPSQTQASIPVEIDAAPLYDQTKTFTVNLSDPTTPSSRTPSPRTRSSIRMRVRRYRSAAVLRATGPASFKPYDEDFTISLSAASNLPTIVTYATTNGTAVAGTDFTGVSSASVTIPPGETQVTVPILIHFETGWANVPPKTFSVNLINATNAKINGTELERSWLRLHFTPLMRST